MIIFYKTGYCIPNFSTRMHTASCKRLVTSVPTKYVDDKSEMDLTGLGVDVNEKFRLSQFNVIENIQGQIYVFQYLYADFSQRGIIPYIIQFSILVSVQPEKE